ncbi:MAG: hypothetical protein WDA20_14965, partial [Desulfuromonadales bacterium]
KGGKSVKAQTWRILPMIPLQGAGIKKKNKIPSLVERWWDSFLGKNYPSPSVSFFLSSLSKPAESNYPPDGGTS